MFDVIYFKLKPGNNEVLRLLKNNILKRQPTKSHIHKKAMTAYADLLFVHAAIIRFS